MANNASLAHNAEDPDLPQNPDEPADQSSMLKQEVIARPPEFVVGIGASAGGLEALEGLFAHMPLKG